MANGVPMNDDLPHPGCNCGRRAVKRHIAPVLRADLVIAARDRAREPELAAATVAHVMATPVSPRPARYDVVIVSGSPDAAERDERIAAEFARHEHRVFHLGEHRDLTRMVAPNVRRLPLPPAGDELLRELAELRRKEGLEATALFVPATLDPVVAREVRQQWGWRVVGAEDLPDALLAKLDVRVAFDDDGVGDRDTETVRLPATLAWPARWTALDRAIRAAWPRASIIMLTHDNLVFNRLCLASILENTEYPNYELLAIDNASTDGTVEELQRLAQDVPHVRVILNDHNAGFGPGNNQGLAAATGEIFVLLNNDTMVPRGWLTRLARHLRDPVIGLIGPGTNRTCNEAQLDIPYDTYAEFQAVARAQGERHEGEVHSIRMPMMFCTAFRRDVYERLGPLDEQYEVGMFEDEDYALRAKGAGYAVVWTPEVFVHHAYHASIGKLLPTGEYMRLVRLNQGRFEEKWGICWERHRPIPVQAQPA
jgi:GT2 family glycosyltransferase